MDKQIHLPTLPDPSAQEYHFELSFSPLFFDDYSRDIYGLRPHDEHVQHCRKRGISFRHLRRCNARPLRKVVLRILFAICIFTGGVFCLCSSTISPVRDREYLVYGYVVSVLTTFNRSHGAS